MLLYCTTKKTTTGKYYKKKLTNYRTLWKNFHPVYRELNKFYNISLNVKNIHSKSDTAEKNVLLALSTCKVLIGFMATY